VRIAREGYPLIGGAAAVTVLAWLLGGLAWGVVPLALTLFIVSFFRDPERVVPAGPGLVVAPADGRIIKVARAVDDRFLQAEATLISIFMSPLNVHVNRVRPPAG